MDQETLVKKSKWLSKHLRHSPERIGLKLEAGGWVDVIDLLQAAYRNQMALSRVQLEEVVASNDKQRFAFNADKSKIRASQGHSVEVDLQLQPQTPPIRLYHGTGMQFRGVIEKEGIHKMRRLHVHLSRDLQTALKVGARHGKPFVFVIDATAMYGDGYDFFMSDNGVWLVDEVPPQYLSAND